LNAKVHERAACDDHKFCLSFVDPALLKQGVTIWEAKTQQGFATGGMGLDGHFAGQQSSGPNVRFVPKADSCTAAKARRTKTIDDIRQSKRLDFAPIGEPTNGVFKFKV
jgi:6-phosphogluconolactonase/glucosamine-6-phosphate isomerase/deaminase